MLAAHQTRNRRLLTEMFAAKNPMSLGVFDRELLRMDSKIARRHQIPRLGSGATAPAIVLGSRKASIMETTPWRLRDGVLIKSSLFVVDILNEQATMLIPNI
jgi:manganese-dependent inorganic pyrophosphatase